MSIARAGCALLLAVTSRAGWMWLHEDQAGRIAGTAVGQAIASVPAVMCQLEPDQTAERTRHAMAQVAREGRPRSRFLPFGYRSRAHPEATETVAGDRSGLVPHREEQRLLRQMLRLERQGLGSYAIASSLNANGDVNPRTKIPLTRAGVAAILQTAERRAMLGLSAR